MKNAEENLTISDDMPDDMAEVINNINDILEGVYIGIAFSSLLTMTMHSVNQAHEDEKAGMLIVIMDAVDDAIKHHNLKPHITTLGGTH